MARVTLKRQDDGTYATGDGRWHITPDHDREAVACGRGPRIWWISDTTGGALPTSRSTLRDVRRYCDEH